MRKNSKLVYSHPIQKSTLGKATYALRSQTIERVFADAKDKHAMRYTHYRGLAAVTSWVKLKFAVMTFKILAIHEWFLFLPIYPIIIQETLLHCCNGASLTD